MFLPASAANGSRELAHIQHAALLNTEVARVGKTHPRKWEPSIFKLVVIPDLAGWYPAF
jgi:hypothetical protein